MPRVARRPLRWSHAQQVHTLALYPSLPFLACVQYPWVLRSDQVNGSPQQWSFLGPSHHMLLLEIAKLEAVRCWLAPLAGKLFLQNPPGEIASSWQRSPWPTAYSSSIRLPSLSISGWRFLPHVPSAAVGRRPLPWLVWICMSGLTVH